MAKKDNTIEKTYIIRAAENKIKNEMPKAKLDLLKKAVIELNNKDIAVLRLTGKVRKYSDPKRGSIFVYKMSPEDRILFSVDKGNKNIWDVINLNTKKSMLLPIKRKRRKKTDEE